MSILKTLTTRSTKAAHFIKFDHGEDRWISTLLVLRGYKVGYVASTDAYTNCPEGFTEFFNQRRRWIPSTTASILEFLSRINTVRKVNNNVSMLYMMYQTYFHIITIFGPALVLWVMINICVSMFLISHLWSLLLNMIPILIYVLICAYVTNEKAQIQVALVLCGTYTSMMCSFLISGLYETVVQGLLSPWSILFCLILIQIIIVALLHPKEAYYLKYFLIYYTMLPIMQVILYIYSALNMHKVSWGTREVSKIETSNFTEDSWLQDNSLQRGSTGHLSDIENAFWTKLLDKYLHPIDNNNEKAKMNEDLRELRDKTVTTLGILNVMFISIMFVLTSKNVTVKWPFIDQTDDELDSPELEVFNFAIILCLFSIFLFQVVTVFIHRFGTFSEIMRNTKLRSSKDGVKRDPVELVKSLQKKHKRNTLNSSLYTESKNYVDFSDLEEIFLRNLTEDNSGISWFNNNNTLKNNSENVNGYTNYGFVEHV